MKKFILGAVAAGALAIGGAASAQDLGAVIGSLFGYGTPQYGYSTSQPAVVAGTQYGTQYGAPYGATVYSDQYGRRFYYDQYGRQVVLNGATYGTNQAIVGYDSWGRPVYGSTQTYSYPSTTYPYGGSYAYGNSWDRDGDGIANTRDRWPDDRRYW